MGGKVPLERPAKEALNIYLWRLLLLVGVSTVGIGVLGAVTLLNSFAAVAATGAVLLVGIGAGFLWRRHMGTLDDRATL